MLSFNVKSSSRDEMIDVSSQIEQLIPRDLDSGICVVFCPHTTAAVTLNENCDPDVKHDLLRKLDELIAWDSPHFHHSEGNSAAHLKASLFGGSLSIPVNNAKLCLGRWQGVYFCEFDGPRTRTIIIQFLRN